MCADKIYMSVGFHSACLQEELLKNGSVSIRTCGRSRRWRHEICGRISSVIAKKTEFLSSMILFRPARGASILVQVRTLPNSLWTYLLASAGSHGHPGFSHVKPFHTLLYHLKCHNAMASVMSPVKLLLPHLLRPTNDVLCHISAISFLSSNVLTIVLLLHHCHVRLLFHITVIVRQKTSRNITVMSNYSLMTSLSCHVMQLTNHSSWI